MAGVLSTLLSVPYTSGDEEAKLFIAVYEQLLDQ